MLTIKAHFDGKVLVPDEPVDLRPDQEVILRVESVDRKPRSAHDLIGWALKYPPNPDQRPALTDDELWETNKL